jgi:hypothetical protein
MTTITNKDEMPTIINKEVERPQMELDASCNAEELRQVRAENAKLKEKVEYLESDAPRWKTHSDQTFISIDDFFNLRRAMKNKIDHLEKMLNGK